MYLVNESSKLEPVNRDYKIREKSQSLLDHPRMINIGQGHLLTMASLLTIHTFQRSSSLKLLGQSK